MSVIDGKAVRRARRNLGIAQKELARMAGIGQPTLSAIERCRYDCNPRAGTVEKIASALGVDAGEILNEAGGSTALGAGVGEVPDGIEERQARESGRTVIYAPIDAPDDRLLAIIAEAREQGIPVVLR